MIRETVVACGVIGGGAIAALGVLAYGAHLVTDSRSRRRAAGAALLAVAVIALAVVRW